MVQHDNKKEAMWREGKKDRGNLPYKAINYSRCHLFSLATNNHVSYFKTCSAAVSATRMTELDVKAAHTDSQCGSILRKC